MVCLNYVNYWRYECEKVLCISHFWNRDLCVNECYVPHCHMTPNNNRGEKSPPAWRRCCVLERRELIMLRNLLLRLNAFSHSRLPFYNNRIIKINILCSLNEQVFPLWIVNMLGVAIADTPNHNSLSWHGRTCHYNSFCLTPAFL